MLTKDRLMELLHYDQFTGVFTRQIKISHNAKVGDIVGCNSRGYLVSSIDGKLYFLHRLAWLYMYGKFPYGYIDHIDGNKSNNAICNLRDVSNAINTQNTHVARNCNKSTGLLGATLNKRNGRYRAQIKIDGNNIYLGDFDFAEDAHKEYISAKRKYHKGCTI